MALTPEKRKQIIDAAKQAHAEGRPLFPPREREPKPEAKPTPDEAKEAAMFDHMKKFGITPRYTQLPSPRNSGDCCVGPSFRRPLEAAGRKHLPLGGKPGGIKPERHGTSCAVEPLQRAIR